MTPITASTHPHPASDFARGLALLVLKAGAGVLVTSSAVYLLGLLLLHGDTLGRWLPTARSSGLAQVELDQLGQFLALDAPGGLPFATWLVGDDWWRGAGADTRGGVLRGHFGTGIRGVPNPDRLWETVQTLVPKALLMIALLWPAALVAGRLTHAWCQRGPAAVPRWLAAVGLSVPLAVLTAAVIFTLFHVPGWRELFRGELPIKVPILNWYPSAALTPRAIRDNVNLYVIPLLALLTPWLVTWAMFAGRRFRAGQNWRRVGLALGGLAIYQLPGLLAWAGAWGRDNPLSSGFRIWPIPGALSLLLLMLWVLVGAFFLRGLFDLALGRRFGDSAVLADVPADPLLANGVADLGSRGGTLGLRGALASSWMARIGSGLLVVMLLLGLLIPLIVGESAINLQLLANPLRKDPPTATLIILATSIRNSLLMALAAATIGVLIGTVAILVADRLGRSELRAVGVVGRAIGCVTAIPYLVLWIIPIALFEDATGLGLTRMGGSEGIGQVTTVALLGLITAPVAVALTRRAIDEADGDAAHTLLAPRQALAFTWSAAWALTAEVWAIQGPLGGVSPFRSLGMLLVDMNRTVISYPWRVALFLATIVACILPFVLLGLALRRAAPGTSDTLPAGRSPIPAYNSES